MKNQAQIVIVGGGIVGAQIAYHLAKMGRKDIVLVEKGEIASGKSSHAAGLVTQFATAQTMLKFRMYSIELYSELGLLRSCWKSACRVDARVAQGFRAKCQPR